MTSFPEGVTSVKAADLTAEQVAEAMNRGFEGYLVPVAVTARDLDARLRGEGLDPFASRVLIAGDRPAGLALIARRGWSSRVAAMGIAPEWRGLGVGKLLLQNVVAGARARGDRRLLLEVFTRNLAALRLYERAGFVVTRRLLGYRRPPGAPESRGASGGDGASLGSAQAAVAPTEGGDDRSHSPSQRSRGHPAALEEIDPLELSRLVVKEGDPDLPWMLAPETLASALAPVFAVSLARQAFGLLRAVAPDTLAMRCLVVRREVRRMGWGTRLVEAIAAAHPVATLRIPQIVPEHIADAFLLRTGWQREELEQFEMELDLRGS